MVNFIYTLDYQMKYVYKQGEHINPVTFTGSNNQYCLHM